MWWKILAPVFLASLLSWCTWASLGITDSVEKKTFRQHIEDNHQQFIEIIREIQRQRESIEDKLDEIQEKL